MGSMLMFKPRYQRQMPVRSHVLGETKRVVAAVEGHKLRLEEDVTVDGQVRLASRLDATKASCKKKG